jgi:uncharacterized protein with GYD domain
MHVAILANATDEACKTEHEEGARFAELKQAIAATGVALQGAWGLLGKYDYLLILDIGPDPLRGFAALSLIARSGSMRTESMLAMPLESYFELASDGSPPG